MWTVYALLALNLVFSLVNLGILLVLAKAAVETVETIQGQPAPWVESEDGLMDPPPTISYHQVLPAERS